MFHMERDAIHFACDLSSQYGWAQLIATFVDTMNRWGATISLETGYKLLINVESANPGGPGDKFQGFQWQIAAFWSSNQSMSTAGGQGKSWRKI